MRILLASIVLPPLVAEPAAAQTGDPQAGRTLWEGANSSCGNCHGVKGEGAFGPDRAGRKLTVAQFTQAVCKPWGIMPAFVESQVSARDIDNLLAYFSSMPSVERPGSWGFTPAPPGPMA